MKDILKLISVIGLEAVYGITDNNSISCLFQMQIGLSRHTDIYLLDDMDADTLVER